MQEGQPDFSAKVVVAKVTIFNSIRFERVVRRVVRVHLLKKADRMSRASDTIKKFGGEVLLGLAALVTLIALVLVFWLVTTLVQLGQGGLPLVAIGGVVVLVLALTTVAIVFAILGLTNGSQAMGLPEGSIRAVIALSLIVLFSILSVFLYQGVSSGTLRVLPKISEAEKAQFLRDNPAARDVFSVISRGEKSEWLVERDSKGVEVKKPDGTLSYLYDLQFRMTNPAGDDFAKQLLVLLGTLMTAITSCYLGAGTATSAGRMSDKATETAEAVASAAPKVTSVKPDEHLKANGSIVNLEILGTGLGAVTGV
ncbi:MAG: hypothetical protein EON54_25065, partial [Alcaligenaceae bacterium]